MKIGLAGLGKMGILHASILNTIKDVEIVAIAEKENSLSKYIKDALPSTNLYQNYENMIDSETLDLMYITTPVPLHLPMIMSCLSKNIGFFVEKPLSSNPNEARQILSKLKINQIFNAVGYNMRFIDTFVKTKEILEKGILGEITNVKSSMYIANIFSKPNGWRFKKKVSAGGVLLDFGCHLLDLLSWYFGSVNNVTGKTKSVYSEVEDFASATLEFNNNIKVDFDTSWSKEGYRMPETSLEIFGSNGIIKVNQDLIEINLEEKVSMFENKQEKIFKQSLDKGVHFDVGGPEFTKQDVDVVEKFREGGKPRVDIQEAFRTQCIIDAIYESAKTNSKKEVEYD